jgi:hypothetical protein
MLSLDATQEKARAHQKKNGWIRTDNGWFRRVWLDASEGLPRRRHSKYMGH